MERLIVAEPDRDAPADRLGWRGASGVTRMERTLGTECLGVTQIQDGTRMESLGWKDLDGETGIGRAGQEGRWAGDRICVGARAGYGAHALAGRGGRRTRTARAGWRSSSGRSATRRPRCRDSDGEGCSDSDEYYRMVTRIKRDGETRMIRLGCRGSVTRTANDRDSDTRIQ